MKADVNKTSGSAKRAVLRVERGLATSAEDWLAEEVPIAVHIDGSPFAVMMATPNDLEDFAYGFALSEGLVIHRDAIREVTVREVLEGVELNIATVAPRSSAERTPGERSIPGRSGCGICGSRELEDVVRHPRQVVGGPTVETKALERALAMLGERQPVNALTGAVHAAAWADPYGDVVLVREDVGRHNALDKLIGAMLRKETDPLKGFLAITSRASYEMVTKAATAGISLMAAISAPTALAVHLARDCGVTLVGFARPGRHVIYTHPERMRHDHGG
jgi:FdhD protein